MEKSRDNIIKRLKMQIYAVFGVWAFVLSITLFYSFISLGLIVTVILSIIVSVVCVLCSLPFLLKYKSGIDVVSSQEPVICSVTRKDTKQVALGAGVFHQVAFFMYNNKECYGFDYEKTLNEIQVGQQIYVWKIRERYYEISHLPEKELVK